MNRASGRFDVTVVGGGVAGLAAAFELRRRHPDLRLLVLEKGERAGGRALTLVEEHYTVDMGPNGFLASPETMEFMRQLGLDGELAEASPAARRRYLYIRGRMQEVPATPPKLLATPLLSPWGKLRALAELLARPPRSPVQEETVYRFAARHFGREVAELASAATLGVAAVDGREASLDALFPRLRRLEAEHGSLLKGLSRARRAGGAPGRLTSFRTGGVGRLGTALAEALGSDLRTGSEVTGIAPAAGGYTLQLAGGSELTTAAVVLALPAQLAARLLRPFLPEAAEPLSSMRSCPVDSLAFAFDRSQVPGDLQGFGVLVARGEGIRTLGVLWDSQIHEGRAPRDAVLLRAIAGGPADEEFSGLSDDMARSAVLEDLRKVMGIEAQPRRWWRFSHPAGLPHYSLGHRERVERAMDAVAGRIVLAGDSYHGVGLGACLADAGRVANEAQSLVAGRTGASAAGRM